MGNETRKFELELGAFFQRPVVCVASGTAALHLALQAIGIRPKDEVLVPSLTYVATFQAISATGGVPIPCEVCADTGLLDLADAVRKKTPRTKCIIPVHFAGQPCDLMAIHRFARRENIRVIEDAAHAFGSLYGEKKIGSFGDIACFSFDGIKNITSGEGGCVVSADPRVIQRVKDARLLGVRGDSEKRYRNRRSWKFDVTEQGWRYHMSNLMAGIGRVQLKKFSLLKKKRQQAVRAYWRMLRGQPFVQCLTPADPRVVPHIFCVKLGNQRLREKIRNRLTQRGVQTGLHYYPNHWLRLYRKDWSLPQTEALSRRLLTLPLHPLLKPRDIRLICRVILERIPCIRRNND
jgi:dTDP-4-amino-4,6-dideoxygalactose transaminase